MQNVYQRALKELAMLGRTEQERQVYESRRIAQLDYNTGMKKARMEGVAEGEARGVIRVYQRLLGQPATSTVQSSTMTLEELTRLADDLQAQVAKLKNR